MKFRSDSAFLMPWLCVLLLGCAAPAGEAQAAGKDADELERRLELQRHTDLLARISLPDSTVTSFTTDGCSGGLSVGWEYLAARIERLQQRHGVRPPWEECCVAHDRLYHAGPGTHADAEKSFEARRAADLALQACVLETGKARAPELSVAYDVSPQTVELLYTAIAQLTYRTVRIGGVPCSGLPWRWGYGWPECG